MLWYASSASFAGYQQIAVVAVLSHVITLETRALHHKQVESKIGSHKLSANQRNDM